MAPAGLPVMRASLMAIVMFVVVVSVAIPLSAAYLVLAMEYAGVDLALVALAGPNQILVAEQLILIGAVQGEVVV